MSIYLPDGCADPSDMEHDYLTCEDYDAEPLTAFTGHPACSACFDDLLDESAAVKCWTCGKRLHKRAPCAREAAGDWFCAAHWTDAMNAAYEASETVRTAYRNTLVKIAATGDFLLAAMVLAGSDPGEPTLAEKLGASIQVEKHRKAA